jgi:holo-[acyl-carrier protein] synthase
MSGLSEIPGSQGTSPAEGIAGTQDGPGIPSVGVDIIEIGRVAEVIERWGPRFLERVYTPAELHYCRGRIAELAARFAGKEAISKALGTGIRGLAWRDMEILPDMRGKPLVALHDRAATRAAALGLRHFAISLSHSRDYAVAMVMAT